MIKYSKRFFGLDLIRCLAVFFVISVHSFIYQEFYSMPLDSKGKLILLIFRSLFFTCVPLFLLLTGYLNGKAELTKKYFVKILKILISYLIIGILCIIYSRFFMHEKVYWLQRLISIFNFSADGYAWYVEMYIGLFLLIPFLNILYNNLTNEQKKTLICVLILMTALPPLMSGTVYNGVALDIFPDYWISIYPITYFFIGRYLKDKPLEISKKNKVLLIIILLIIQAVLSYLYVNKGTFDWGFLGGYGNIFTLIIATLIFTLFADLKCNNTLISKSINRISVVSFEIYLISAIFDKIYYPILYVSDGYSFMNFVFNYLKIVPIVFVSSFACAMIINKISTFLYLKLQRVLYKKMNIN